MTPFVTRVAALGAALAGLLTLAASAQQGPPAAPAQPATPGAAAATPSPALAKIVPVGFEEAVIGAANNLLSKAQLPPGDAKLQVVIDPLIDGQTGHQSPTSQVIGRKIAELIKKSYPRFEVVPFTPENVARKPLLLIGTFTAINTENKPDQPRDAYRLCLALADLGSNKLVSKGVGFMTLSGIDAAPTGHFRDSPVWTRDPAVEGYVRTCQGTRVGDAINAQYVGRIGTSAVIASAIAAYDAKNYRQALDLYQKALAAPGGDQLRVHNGIYLANWRMKRLPAAADAFARIVDHGLTQEKLAVMFLFNSGSSLLAEGKAAAGVPYALWIEQIAKRTAQRKACLEVVGHASRVGSEAINARLSTLRAEQIRARLIAAAKGASLGQNVIANGMGSREVIVGTTPDGPTNALDRRVEMKVLKCA